MVVEHFFLVINRKMQRGDRDLEWVIFLMFSIKQQLLFPSCQLCCQGDFVRMAQSRAGGFSASTLLPGNVTAPVNSWMSKPLPLTLVRIRLQEQNSLLRSFSTALPHWHSLVFSLPLKWNIWNISFWHFKFHIQFLVFSSKETTDNLINILNISGSGSKHSQ